jgi:cell division FtsZ-interacting protein ZapD
MHNNGKTEDLKDEVYRQMFRLEESKPGAEISLALALLRAWIACGSKRESCEARVWLKTISPICLALIESALHAGGTPHSCSQ